jgi:hypothetical protein
VPSKRESFPAAGPRMPTAGLNATGTSPNPISKNSSKVPLSVNKAVTFNSKIRNLNEFHNNTVNSSLAANNSGTEVVLALNYFSQELLTVLKDVAADESSLAQADVAHETPSTGGQRQDTSGSSSTVLDGSGSSPSISLLAVDKEPNIYATAGRIKVFPELNYATLYHSLNKLIDIIPNVQINQIGKSYSHSLNENNN